MQSYSEKYILEWVYFARQPWVTVVRCLDLFFSHWVYCFFSSAPHRASIFRIFAKRKAFSPHSGSTLTADYKFTLFFQAVSIIFLDGIVRLLVFRSANHRLSALEYSWPLAGAVEEQNWSKIARSKKTQFSPPSKRTGGLTGTKKGFPYGYIIRKYILLFWFP